MNYLLYFYLAHFLSDYPLQPSALVKYKRKHFLGVFIHSTVHLVMMFIILMPFLYNVRAVLAIIAIYISHNIIDQTKVSADKANPKKARLNYFLDQFAHWSVILISVWCAGPLIPHLSGRPLELYTDQSIFLFLMALTLSTYFFDVTRYFVRLKMFKEEFERDYKTMLINAGIVTAAFGIYCTAY
jgi:hypothetical protein